MAEKSCFAEIHQELDAKMVPCGKFDLPLFYPGGSAAEHRHVRSGAGIFDRSGIRCFQITGKDAASLLDHLFLRSTADLAVGGALRNALLDEDGGVAVVFTLCRMQENDFMLLADPGCAEKNIALLQKTGKGKLEFRELTGAMAFLTVAGEKSGDILLEAGAAEVPETDRWQMISLHDDEGDELRCIAVGGEFFGSAGYLLCCNAALALEIYGALYRVNGAVPAGTGAWESLRIESGEPGTVEFAGNPAPDACGLGSWVDDKRKFYGSEALPGRSGQMVLALTGAGRYPALPGSVVKLPGDIPAGVVTSGSFCPSVGKAQMLCRFAAASGISCGTALECEINGEKTVVTVIAVIK